MRYHKPPFQAIIPFSAPDTLIGTNLFITLEEGTHLIAKQVHKSIRNIPFSIIIIAMGHNCAKQLLVYAFTRTSNFVTVLNFCQLYFLAAPGYDILIKAQIFFSKAHALNFFKHFVTPVGLLLFVYGSLYIFSLLLLRVYSSAFGLCLI